MDHCGGYKMNTDLEEVMFNLQREVNRAVERKLVETVERRLGRVPTDLEIIESGQCLKHPDGGTTYTWDGIILFEWRLEWYGTRPALEFREFLN